MQLTPEEYLHGVYKEWPGDWEGDFDYVDGQLQRHDWGDYPHSRMHSELLGWFGQHDRDWHIRVLPSLTLEITPTRFRVPDLVIFDRSINAETFTRRLAPLVVMEVLSPEDTMMHVAALDADYRQMGIRNIWVIDPRQKTGWNCQPSGWLRTETFALPGTPITLNLSNLVLA